MDEAKKQVQEIAVRAIEGAPGSKTLAHVNEIAMERAKHRDPQSLLDTDGHQTGFFKLFSTPSNPAIEFEPNSADGYGWRRCQRT